MTSRSRTGTGALGAALLGSLAAVVLFSSTGQDDCHITFWSAWTLSELGEIVNHSGERVEQSSSLLHTLLLAGLHRVTRVPLPWLGYVLGIVAAVVTIVRLPVLARCVGWRLRRGSSLVFAFAPAFAYWQLGSLESSLFTWCCVEFLIGLARLCRAVSPLACSPPGLPDEEASEEEEEAPLGGRGVAAFVAWTGALTLVRPEAGLLATGVAGLLALAGARDAWRRGSLRWLVVAVAVPGLWFAGSVAFRLTYFERAFPQPVVAKMGGTHSLTLEKLGDGLIYLGDRFASLSGALLVVGLLAGVFVGLRDLRLGRWGRCAPTLLIVAYMAFIVMSGGDWMKGWRFVAHVEPLILLTLLHAAGGLQLGPRLWAAVCAALVAVNVHGMVEVGGAWGTGRPIWTAWQVDPAVRAFAGRDFTWPERANQVHTRDIVMVEEMNAVLGAVLRSSERVSILSKQAGLVTYYAALEHHGRIEFIDRLGLSSRHFDEARRELDLATGPMGLTWDLEDLFRHGVERSEPAFRPDVIFDLHRKSAALVEQLGYVVVYEQGGLTSGRWASAGERAPRTSGPAPMDLLRVRPPTGEFDGVSPWSEETNMYQFIAVRGDLARRAGLVSVQDARAVLGASVAASAHTLYWDDARRPYLRGADGAASTAARPALPRVSTFELSLPVPPGGSAEGARRPRRIVFEGGPRTVSALVAVAQNGERRALVEGRHYRVLAGGTPDVAVELTVDLGLDLERIEASGLGVAFDQGSARARLDE